MGWEPQTFLAIQGFAMLDAPEDMAGLPRNEDTREVARGNLVGVTGMASVQEDVGTRTDTIGRV